MIDLDDIKQSELTNFSGEIFYDQILKKLQKEKEQVWIKQCGMNSRASSKDIIDLKNINYLVGEEMNEAVVISLSRNSIYHHLPEFLFHPLVISNPSMSNKEIVEAVKTNRKNEQDNISFFTPFDTVFFEKKVELSNRYLNIYTDKQSKKILFAIAKELIGIELALSKEQIYKLFLNLCEAEKLKENLPALEELFFTILGFKVQLSYVKHQLSESPFDCLGEAILGQTLGVNGRPISEFEDVEATLFFKDGINYKRVTKYSDIVRSILGFFIISTREVHIKFQTKGESSFVLGEDFLGYNTQLTNSN